MSFDRANPPALTITIPLESGPRIHLCNCNDEADRLRLRAWLEHHRDLAELFDHARQLELLYPWAAA